MIVLIVTLFLISGSQCQHEVLTPARRNARHQHNIGNIAIHSDAEHRGDRFYDLSSKPTSSSSKFGSDTSSSSVYSDELMSESHSSDASSAITNERRSGKKLKRDCTPCIHEMLKKHTNLGIKWICGTYQRARRTFKSVCMMRYRNCQDGTMFVKMADHKCHHDSFHGHAWSLLFTRSGDIFDIFVWGDMSSGWGLGTQSCSPLAWGPWRDPKPSPNPEEDFEIKLDEVVRRPSDQYMHMGELLALPQNVTSTALTNVTAKPIIARRQLGSDEDGKRKKRGRGYRSTSSSSGEKAKKGSNVESKRASADISLGLSTEFSTNEDSTMKMEKRKDKYGRESSDERKGWKKWHRKCHPCPEEMSMNWKDPSIKWICGAYQRARRSFKSLCMMHYRNCQDGTMFVKIHDHRCESDRHREGGVKHGEHMFYTYIVQTSANYEDSTEDSNAHSDTASDIYEDKEFYRV